MSDRTALWADFHGGRPVERGAAIISQSGNLSLILSMADRALPLSHLISNGNQAVLEASDFVDLLVDDPRVSAIGLYVEGLRDIPKFWRAAVRALRTGKPIVALKSGVSKVGSQMTLHQFATRRGTECAALRSSKPTTWKNPFRPTVPKRDTQRPNPKFPRSALAF